MREEEIRRLIKIVEESNIGELEIRHWGRTIKISKYASNSGYSNSTPAPSAHVAAAPTQVQQVPAAPEHAEEKPAVTAKSGTEIKSPMVGTFYRAPAPDADPYVEVGHTVKKGQVLCIIEAMKLMNEIESEVDGKIVEILVEEAQPVEYNQPLFMIEPA